MEQYEKEILDYCCEYCDVTFVTIEDMLREHITVKGNGYLEIKPNCIVWAGMSDAFLDFWHIIENKISLRKTGPFIYIYDGKALLFPICNSIRKYKKPHWYPVTIGRKRI